jgi:hypothetical protein
MHDRRRQDRLYTAILMAFLIALVALGLLGVPALPVAAIGVAVAALGIGLFHRFFEAGGGATPRLRGARQKVPDRYVPSVLQGSSTRRHRIGFSKRHRGASPPLRLR